MGGVSLQSKRTTENDVLNNEALSISRYTPAQ